LDASRTAEVITAVRTSAPCCSIASAYWSSAANTRACGWSPSAPVASTPSPSRVTIDSRCSSLRPSPPTSATSSRVELVPMSTTATRVT
jgi:hypothetical protein